MWYYAAVVERQHADVAQSVERILGKDEVTGSNPVISSRGSEHVVSMGSGLFCTSKKLPFSAAKIQNPPPNPPPP